MITELSVKNFRGLKELTLADLRQITLISGRNNVGKSAILESIFLFFGRAMPNVFSTINQLRGLPVSADMDDMIAPMFHEMDTKREISIRVKKEQQDYTLTYTINDSFSASQIAEVPKEVTDSFLSGVTELKGVNSKFEGNGYSERGFYIFSKNGVLTNTKTGDGVQRKNLDPVWFLNSYIARNDHVMIIDLFGKLELSGQKREIMPILQLLDAEIEDVLTISQKGNTQLFVKREGKVFPLKLAGDGLCNLLYIVLVILMNPGSIILIDEVETGFHYSLYGKLWEVIATTAKKTDCQIIATTHSYECIEKSLDGVKQAGMDHNFCYYRIENKDGNRGCLFDSKMLSLAVRGEMEIR